MQTTMLRPTIRLNPILPEAEQFEQVRPFSRVMLVDASNEQGENHAVIRATIVSTTTL